MIQLYKTFIILLIFTAILNISFAQKADKFRIKTVVIDPGHGGKDSGASYGKLYEKDIVLDVALNLGKKIKKSYPSVKIVYTRTKDVFIPLSKRGEIANKAEGDLFISIHANAAENKKALGTETFTLGIHKSAANLEVAKKENSVISLEEDYKKTYQGFDPSNAESYIMFGLGQYSYNMSSISYAHFIETNYKKTTNMSSRGIKQAGFLVLWQISMPSVLTEIGFMSNSKDRAFLSSKEGREKVSKSLFDAFSQYKKSVEVESKYSSDVDVNIESVSSALDKTTDKDLKKYNKSITGYAVQLITSKKKIPISESSFGKQYRNIFEINVNNSYKYFIGVMDSYNDVLSLRSRIRRSKYKDCFVVGVKNGKIVSHQSLK